MCTRRSRVPSGTRKRAALHRVRDLCVIAVVPRYPDRDGHVSGPLQRIGQVEAVELVRRAGGERVGLIARPEGLVLDLAQLGVARAVLPLQIEVFAYRVVEYAHDPR